MDIKGAHSSSTKDLILNLESRCQCLLRIRIRIWSDLVGSAGCVFVTDLS
jgi:hypothetical protein